MEIRDKVCSVDALYKSMNKCKLGVTWKDSVARYINNPLVYTLKLREELLNDAYKISDYYHFTIYEPKCREIISTRFRDRVFQRSLCDNYFYGAITKDFIYDNGACQINKGTDFTRNRLCVHMHKFYRHYGTSGYILKCDLKNFFGSTPHAVIKRVVAKRVKDAWVLKHIYAIIDSYDTGDQIGVGLGSQITQLVQLAVLSDLDHYIKEQLGIAFYVRYMDDFILIHHDKEYLQKCLKVIAEILADLGLKLNENKTKLFPISQGVNFLGFKYTLTETGKVVMTLLEQGHTKAKRKIRKHAQLVEAGLMTREKMFHCYESRRAHISKGSTYYLLEQLDDYFLNYYGGIQCLSS